MVERVIVARSTHRDTKKQIARYLTYGEAHIVAILHSARRGKAKRASVGHPSGSKQLLEQSS